MASVTTIEERFRATEEHGDVSSLLILPPNAETALVLGHGASSHLRHRTVETIAEHLAEVGVGSFRYNFPYSEHGRGRNSNAVCQETIRSAVAAARAAAGGVTWLAGGHSFSGRMTSLAQAEAPLEGVRGLVFFAFPLHPAGKPSDERAAHLSEIDVPMLFLSGTRDSLAEPDLLEAVVRRLGSRATLHLLDTADHSFRVLKRSRASDEDVFDEMARVLREWARQFD